MYSKFSLHRTKDSQSEIVKYLLMCLQCCLWCFEKVMKFINRNAYIYTGEQKHFYLVHLTFVISFVLFVTDLNFLILYSRVTYPSAFKGTAFCSSCKKVFGLLMSNLVRVGVINCVGSFILFLGKFLVVIITGMLGYFMLQVSLPNKLTKKCQ